jgi:formylglycine-generating enzyme required for sulfatase activity
MATAATPVSPLEPTLITIPAAWFLMGSSTGQDCERPVHRVFVGAFLLASTQVTNAEYALFVKLTSVEPPPFFHDENFNHPRQPVTGVSWFDAEHYCSWLSQQTAHTYRLPTEAEWERAARADLEQNDFPWGNIPPQSLPDYPTRWLTGPEPVALYAPNALGLFNICDNVHEWCSDWYDPNYYAISPDRNPRGPALDPQSASRDAKLLPRKASRGGSWRHHVKVSRCSARSSIPPDFHYADYGFRLACDI